MAILEWNDTYSVGDAHLDAQHKGLIELINRLDDATRVGEVLDGLARYVAEHFRDEERMLEASDFPGLEAHKEQHRVFEVWLAEKQEAFRRGRGSPILRDSVQSYLRVWLANHILFADRAYSGYLR